MKSMSAWERVMHARNPQRPKAKDLLPHIFEDFIELCGDRHFGDDAALYGGLATFEGTPVTVLAQSKGRNLQENLECHFGMVSPEGYRKAQRLAKQAEKFHRPIITFVDTAGAFPGKEAEERGQAEAIATSLKLFATLKTPIIAIVLSEGGSGGALALSVADRIYMFENAIYSILSPEGFASILWKDESRAKEAAELLECTSFDLLDKGIIDGIIEESEGGLHQHQKTAILLLKEILRKELGILSKKKVKQLLDERYQKFRVMGNV